MVLNNIKLLHGKEPVNIIISEGRIAGIETKAVGRTKDQFQVNFTGAVALPGLINSHDHLDFNCFSTLGTRTYNNYTEWGKHIHETYKDEIDAVLKIPANLRASWGMYKNLLAGVTTAVNHGPFLTIENPLINIQQSSQSLHSVRFQKKWKWKLNNPFLKNKDCVIHAGEGSDQQSSEEIDQLLQWNLLKRKLVGIHGVAMNARQAKKFKALVWCPESNRVLLNKDADVKNLKEHTRMVLGTDSTLTGNWNIWHHLRVARKTRFVSDEELFDMVTGSAADLWNLNKGEIAVNKDADIIIARTNKENVSCDDLYAIDPENILMVIQEGKIRLFDEELFPQLDQIEHSNFKPVTINGETKYVEGDLPALIAAIKKYYPRADLPCHHYEKTKMTPDDQGR
jgi:cytosine/adenosine deaminase-related metal-dependent hydrolase